MSTRPKKVVVDLVRLRGATSLVEETKVYGKRQDDDDLTLGSLSVSGNDI